MTLLHIPQDLGMRLTQLPGRWLHQVRKAASTQVTHVLIHLQSTSRRAVGGPQKRGALTSSSCAALGRVSGFLSRATFRKSRNSTDLRAQASAVGTGRGEGEPVPPQHRSPMNHQG